MATPLEAADALGHLTSAQVVGVTVVGDVDEGLLEQVLGACQPKPVQVAVYNTTDTVAKAVVATNARLRVGVASSNVKARLVVQTEDAQFVFNETITVRRSRSRTFNDIYTMLVPFDGASLASSVEQATPARQEVLAWVAGRKEGFSPAVMSYGRLRTFPTIRTVLFFSGVVFASLALVSPLQSLWLIISIFLLCLGASLHLNLHSLRKRFGLLHE